MSLYDILLSDTAVSNSDTVLTNLRDSLADTETGVIHRAFAALSDTSTSSSTYTSYADTLDKEVTDFNAGQTTISYLAWLMDLRANVDTLDADDVDDLIELAEKCPYTEGMAVIMARAMLNSVDSLSFREWTDTCEFIPDSIGPGPSFRLAQPESEFNEQETESGSRLLLVYPNPTRKQITVVLPLNPEKPWRYDLSGVDGVTVKSSTIVNQKQELRLRNLSAGIYHLRIYDDLGEQLYSERIVILTE